MRRQALLRQAAPFFANWHAEAQRQLQQLRLRLQPYFVAWREFAGLHRLLFIKVCSGGALPCSSTRLIQWQSGKAESNHCGLHTQRNYSAQFVPSQAVLP